MKHPHLALQLTAMGHVMVPRATCHPDRLADAADIRYCAICASTCYIHIRTVRYLAANPATVVLCCECSNLTDAAIMAAIPGTSILAVEVPDLAGGGVFN